MKLKLELIPWTPPTKEEEYVKIEDLPHGTVFKIGNAAILRVPGLAGTHTTGMYLSGHMSFGFGGVIPKRDVLGILGADGKYTEYDNSKLDLVDIFDLPPGVVFKFPENPNSLWWITQEKDAQCLLDGDGHINTGPTYNEEDFEDEENLIPRSHVLGMMVPVIN